MAACVRALRSLIVLLESPSSLTISSRVFDASSRSWPPRQSSSTAAPSPTASARQAATPSSCLA
eukprot:CAMPEP_0203972262 /NCGR_PEP_ID=MMETSP0359-20131031/98954_1 /ASSEMBLY_ACC=CAM_ASM_000338 /TAXON_ID=268821 /ORGANISM="Scrippsiella Hangoei, Strain SHTV-5" /LENGTH=63 /DNA_ID=CAMNT_0050910349 /DNA_START=46 /DNA_END=233 /DNA_ORIENTATION=-